jgi:3-hydroxyisobutyrate dehydrogenase-like beta-hydroxyacid dehydrogenase
MHQQSKKPFMTTSKEDSQNKNVSVIGLGPMGQALASAFLQAGYSTTVWNRTAAKADQLVAQGAKRAGSVSEAVTAGELVITCVSDYDAVYELLDLPGDALANRTLVNLTSSSSEQARTFAAWAAERNIPYLDGAIMAIPPAIGTDEAVLLYSGSSQVFEHFEPVLRHLSPSGTTYLGADHGLSSLYDVAILGMMWSLLNSFYQGAALLETAGVKASVFAQYAKPLAETIAGWLPAEAQLIDDRTHLDPAAESSVNTSLAAMDHLIHESEAYGLNADLPRLLKNMADRAVADGHGGASYAAVIEQLRKPSK